MNFPLETQTEDRCPRCLTGRLRSWDELDAEEREVVRRLPASLVSSADERATRHRWCTRCWHEETDAAPRDV
jgi:hypothetical protein